MLAIITLTLIAVLTVTCLDMWKFPNTTEFGKFLDVFMVSILLLATLHFTV